MPLTTFTSFAIPPVAQNVDVTVASNEYMALGQFHDLTDGVLLMHGIIRGIAGNVITFENIPKSDGATSGTMGDGDITQDAAGPIANGLVAGEVPHPTNDIRDVLLGTAVFGRLRESPVIIQLHQVALPTTLDQWVDILPATTFPLPRTEDSLIEVALSLHLMWTGNNGAQAYCDWSIDTGTHFRRTYHTIMSKQNDADVNGVDLVFWQQVTGTSPSIRIQGREHAGATGITVIGQETSAYPQLQSYAIIFDAGPM